MDTTIGNTIWKQISIMTKMACGMRDPKLLDSGLSVKVGGRMTWIEITLTPADTYTVELVKISKRQGRQVRLVPESFSDVYCDQLSEIVYAMVNK